VFIRLGTWCGATNLNLLKERNITRVVNSCGRCFQRFGEKEGVQFLHLKLEDIPSQEISSHFCDVINFIDNAIKGIQFFLYHTITDLIILEKRNTLVHCAQGRSRSASFVIGTLI
jgi:protein-tyrosine phosphatase